MALTVCDGRDVALVELTVAVVEVALALLVVGIVSGADQDALRAEQAQAQDNRGE